MQGDLSNHANGLPLARPVDFKSIIDDSTTDLVTLRLPGSLVAQVTNYGARIVNLFVPDRTGQLGNVVLGFNSLDEYLNAKERFYGATVGRYANRIGRARFELDGVIYQLPSNEGVHHLHGGISGFDRVVWDILDADDKRIILGYSSRHKEEGYPGALSVRLTYQVSGDLALTIDYEARTHAPTPINLTHHSYFNLAGPGSGPVSEHALQILADEFTVIDEDLIPTGEIRTVEDTPLDFRRPIRIGERIDEPYEQLRLAGGYDHNWVLRPASGPMRPAARVYEPETGRVMEVLTTEPGLQFYGGNFFDGSDLGASGHPHRYREAFALETQHFPDGPNKEHFPSTILRPGEVYRSRTIYRFYPAALMNET